MTEKQIREGAAALETAALSLMSIGILSFLLPILGIQLRIVTLLSNVVPAPGLVAIGLGVGLLILGRKGMHSFEEVFRAQREAEHTNPQVVDR